MRRLAPLLALAGTALAACNGRDEYCGRKYSNITYLGAHDSAFVGELPTHNQYVSVSAQLDLGVRFLQAQTHDKDGAIEMCHTYCLELDEGTLGKYLQEVAGWLQGKPDEVVTLLLTNGDKIPVEKFDQAFADAGLKEMVFHPGKVLAKDEWPTLQEMMDAGTRLVVFMGAYRRGVEGAGRRVLTWAQIITWTRPRSTTSSTSLTTFGKQSTASRTRRFRRATWTGRRTVTQASSWV